MRTQVCEACRRELLRDEFKSEQAPLGVLWVDSVCIRCRMAGRKSLKELIEEYGKHGGRPRIELPVDEVKRLHQQGLGCKAIATKLREQGYEVSHSTIQRRLNDKAIEKILAKK